MKILHFKGMDNLMIMLIPLFPYCAMFQQVVRNHFWPICLSCVSREEALSNFLLPQISVNFVKSIFFLADPQSAVEGVSDSHMSPNIILAALACGHLLYL